MRAYTPTSSDDDLGHFDLVIKVGLQCRLAKPRLSVLGVNIGPSLQTSIKHGSGKLFTQTVLTETQCWLR